MAAAPNVLVPPAELAAALPDMEGLAVLFSLGVTVYTLLRGRNPFVHAGASAYEIAVTTRHYHATTLDIPDDRNDGLSNFLKLLMNKDIGARPPSARLARAWFERLVGGTPS